MLNIIFKNQNKEDLYFKNLNEKCEWSKQSFINKVIVEQKFNKQ